MSAGYQLHSCTSLDDISSDLSSGIGPQPASASASPTPNVDNDARTKVDFAYDIIHAESPAATRAKAARSATAEAGLIGAVAARKESSNGIPSLFKCSQQSILMLASLQAADSLVAKRGVQLAVFRSRWSLADSVSPSWEVYMPTPSPFWGAHLIYSR